MICGVHRYGHSRSAYTDFAEATVKLVELGFRETAKPTVLAEGDSENVPPLNIRGSWRYRIAIPGGKKSPGGYGRQRYGKLRMGDETKSVFLDHDLGGFHDRDDLIALVELQLFGAAPCDGAFNQILAHPDDYMGHDVAQLDFFDGSAQLVPR